MGLPPVIFIFYHTRTEQSVLLDISSICYGKNFKNSEKSIIFGLFSWQEQGPSTSSVIMQILTYLFCCAMHDVIGNIRKSASPP
jgi:hypothetical protein